MQVRKLASASAGRCPMKAVLRIPLIRNGRSNRPFLSCSISKLHRISSEKHSLSWVPYILGSDLGADAISAETNVTVVYIFAELKRQRGEENSNVCKGYDETIHAGGVKCHCGSPVSHGVCGSDPADNKYSDTDPDGLHVELRSMYSYCSTSKAIRISRGHRAQNIYLRRGRGYDHIVPRL